MVERGVLVDGELADATTLYSLQVELFGTTMWTVGPRTLPVEALEDGDRQIFAAFQASQARGASVLVDDAPIDIHMPPPITTVEIEIDGAPSASWDRDASWNKAEIAMHSADGLHDMYTTAFPGWVAATGATDSLVGVDVREMPGWDPAWEPVVETTQLLLTDLHADGTAEAASFSISAP